MQISRPLPESRPSALLIPVFLLLLFNIVQLLKSSLLLLIVFHAPQTLELLLKREYMSLYHISFPIIIDNITQSYRIVINLIRRDLPQYFFALNNIHFSFYYLFLILSLLFLFGPKRHQNLTTFLYSQHPLSNLRFHTICSRSNFNFSTQSAESLSCL